MSNFLKSFLFGALFVIFGIGFLFIFGENATLNCTRMTGTINCSLQRDWLKVVFADKQTLRQIQGATVDESCDDNCTYQVQIKTAAGAVPLTSYYSSGYADKNELVAKINNFVNNSGQTNLVVEANIGLFVLIPIGFFIVGIIIWVVSLLTVFRNLFFGISQHKSSSSTIEGKLD